MASISNAPDEVLRAIFDFVPVHDETYAWLCTWHLTSVMLVCKRWAILFEPYLYQSLVFHWGEPRVRPRDVTKCLKKRPYLCGYVRDIFFIKAAEEYDEADYNELLDLVLPIPRLSIATWSPQVMPILHKVAQRDCLRALLVTWFSLCTVLRWFGRANLKRLTLSRVNWKTDTNDWPPLQLGQWDSPDSSILDLQEIHPGLGARTGSLKHLTLTCNTVGAKHLSVFLQWPAALETFEYLRPLVDIEGCDFQPLLDIHKSSLQRVVIGPLPHAGASTNISTSWSQNLTTFALDFSTYPVLIHLGLDVCHDFADQSPDHLGRRLGAPNLRHLTMDFGLDSYQGTSFQTFSSQAAPKIRNVISVLRSRQPTPALSSLHLDFHPTSITSHDDDPGYITRITDDRTYPWDYVTEIQGALAQHEGVRVTWHEMDITREKWRKEIEAAVRRHEETGRVTVREMFGAESGPDESDAEAEVSLV